MSVPTQHRSVVMCSNGVVASAQQLASAAGLRVLMSGGNAADAAIATAAVLTVTMPMMCGLGGDVFAIYYQARTGRVFGINGSGVAPRGATPEYFRSRGYQKMPPHGMLAPSVPGGVDAYFTILERFGTRSMVELVQPAIEYAESGFPVSQHVGESMIANASLLARYPTTTKVLLKPGGEPFRPGDILVQKDMGRSWRMIAEGGRDIFYKGAIARAFVEFSQANGGLFTTEDFAEHRTEVYEPLCVTYRGYDVLQTAPPSQGLIHLEMMNLLECFSLAGMGFNSVESIHTQVEAKKLAFSDRVRYAGDPAFVKFPLKGMLSKKYAARRSSEIDPRKANNDPAAGQPGELDGDTTYFCVVDREGNAISFIHSLSNAFGCAQMVGDTGILPNNRAGRGFSLVEGHPNIIAPGKKTMHTLNCYMVLRNGLPYIVGGTPGGDRQPQINAQILCNLIDYGMNVQEAAEAPRWISTPGTDPINIDDPFQLILEDRIPAGVVGGLEALGHRTKVVGSYAGGGSVMLVQVDPVTGVRYAGVDPRSDGEATGY
ncbi:MAG: gamma-glutamyltransferase [Chloroflexi bacterium]|nr:gamma-glutamyltransferase [Chloroflexota bacterium]